MTHNANIEMTQIIELANKILGAITERFKEQLQTHLKQTKYYAKWKKSDTKSHVVYYFIYMKYPE